MTPEEISLAYEENHAAWWTADGVGVGQNAMKDPAFAWTLADGYGSLHRIRLDSSQAKRKVNTLIRRCLKEPKPTPLHAHVTNHSTPDNLIPALRELGFQHVRRYTIFFRSTQAAPAPPKSIRFETLSDFSPFGERHPHPGFGPIRTKSQKRLCQQLQDRSTTLAPRLSHHVGFEKKKATCSFTLIRSRNLACFYDPFNTTKSQANASVRMALKIASEEKRSHVALICDAPLEPILAHHGFEACGWLSWLYLSKTKLERMNNG